MLKHAAWASLFPVLGGLGLLGGCGDERTALETPPPELTSPPQVAPPPAAAASVIGAVSPQRLRADIDRLAAFGTRHTLSDTVSDERGIGAARRWLRDEFRRTTETDGRTGALAATVSLDGYVQQPRSRVSVPTEIVNVVCTLPGAMPEARGRLYIAGAHYDSRATDPVDAESDAPGANDDGSGTVGLLELARVLAPLELDATVVLVAYAGEEQGLLGSRHHAKTLAADEADVRGILSADMIGDPTGPSDGRGGSRGPSAADRVRVFSAGLPRSATDTQLRNLAQLGHANDSDSRQLARYVADVARRHTTAVQPMLVFRNDRFLRGGDHKSFVDAGFAGVRLTDVYENYDRQHQDLRTDEGMAFGDLPQHVDENYLADVVRLWAAALVSLANAPSAPTDARIIVSSLTPDTTLRWAASPEPDTAGYEVVWRATTSPDWEDSRDFGNVTEATLELSKDNWLFGVRSYDADGYRSPVAFPGVGRE